MSHTTTRVNAVDLKTPAALAILAKRFEPVVLQPDDTPVPLADKDYFSRMAITRNVEHDSGSNATYDVQSDNRFMNNYIMYNIAQDYPEMNVKGHPMVSPLTLAGYCLTMFNAHLLGCDAHFRPQKSYYCKNFFTDAARKDYFEVLLNCHVPTFMADILTEISPVYDARRTNHIYVPSLAAYSHSHDFGRTIPPQVYFAAHHLLATTSTRKEPDDYQDDVYELPIVNFGSQPFCIANYFGTRYGIVHSNWINQDFEAFFNPLVGRSLTQKPTFGKFPLVTQTFADHQSFDIYAHFLIADDDNLTTMSNAMGALSAFFQAHEPKSPKLGNILASLSGSLLFSHSIEPPTLPTWTGQALKTQSGTERSHKEFASDQHFLVAPAKKTGKLQFPTDLSEIFQQLYRLVNKKYDPKKAHNPRVLFDSSVHVNPYVLFFQPYDVSASALSLTIVAGLKIELAEIDGFTVPTEHPESSLDDNNSQYLQSAVRLSDIDTILDSTDPATSPVRILERRLLDRENQATGLAIRDMSKNVLPVFANADVNDQHIQNDATAGFVQEDNHSDPRTAFTYTAGSNGKLTLGSKMKIYAWSSYRVIHKPHRPELKDISMVLSFRAIHGTNVTLSRSKNPALIIPH